MEWLLWREKEVKLDSEGPEPSEPRSVGTAVWLAGGMDSKVEDGKNRFTAESRAGTLLKQVWPRPSPFPNNSIQLKFKFGFIITSTFFLVNIIHLNVVSSYIRYHSPQDDLGIKDDWGE